jgi:hypothetical protein
MHDREEKVHQPIHALGSPLPTAGGKQRVAPRLGGRRLSRGGSAAARSRYIAAPWARRTLRLAQRLVTLGVALGGQRADRGR